MRQLPPLNALVVFESVSRLGGVMLAAKELCVSQSAVSHQLANLEEYLGTKLFLRRNRRLVITQVGKDYMKQVGPALDAIANASIEATPDLAREVLTISAPPSLISNWLLPRLSGFLDGNPNLNLRIHERMELDPYIKETDCAIEYRMQGSKEYQSDHLIPDEWVPLASPTLLEKHPASAIEALKGIPLIETQRRLISWYTILSGYKWLKESRIISVAYSLHAFKAAEVGLGIALGNRYNAAKFVDAGILRIPFEFDAEMLPPAPNYYFSVLPQKENLPKVVTFSKWIKNEVEKTQRDLGMLMENDPCPGS